MLRGIHPLLSPDLLHALSSMGHGDRIAVVARGQVVEEGPPEQLLSRGGPFAALVAAQLNPASRAALG